MPVKQRRAHGHCRRLALFLTQLVVLLDVLVHVAEDFLLVGFTISLQILLSEFLDHVEVVGELIELMLAKWRAQVEDKRYGDGVEDVLMQVFAQFGHGFNQVVLRRDQGMVLEVIYQILLPVLPKEVELNLAGRRSPLEVVQRLRGLDLRPTRPSVHHAFHHLVIIAKHQDVLVELLTSLFIQ